MKINTNKQSPYPKGPNIFGLLKPYKLFIGSLILFTVLVNGLSLIVPKLVATGINNFAASGIIGNSLLNQFIGVTIAIFIFTYIQSLIQTYASEKIASDMRVELSSKISRQSFAYIQATSPATLLTNLTSDIDAIKLFVSQAVSSIIASLFLIVGASILLLSINWRLGLAVLTIVPIIAITFSLILSRVRKLFGKAQEVIDWLNKVINESILGASLIRVLNSQDKEHIKFVQANSEAQELGLKILGYFASLIPIISFVASCSTIVILVLGGHYVIINQMSVGDFAAFNSYVGILIFPIILIGFMSNVIARSSASYARIYSVLKAKESDDSGTISKEIQGEIVVKSLYQSFGQKEVLHDVSFMIKPHTKTAIIGPTAAGKTQLMYLLGGLTPVEKGVITIDKKAIKEYSNSSLHSQIGLVFQDSIIFNLSLKENIAFNENVSESRLSKAIQTAELTDYIKKLPKGLNTIVSERGNSLSGGQKQRIMLARALALDPKVLLLDDFTARVDAQTEQKILANVKQNYPDLTLISVTQKIGSVIDYDQIILLMEGEIIAKGTHKELLKSSPEYVQLYNSQKSTNTYEISAE